MQRFVRLSRHVRGSGFQIGPGVGDVMAELMDTGATSTPIEAFSMARFQRQTAAA